MHVSLANFLDTLIDYPNSRVYAFEMFDRLGALGILSPEMIAKYKQHVENLEHYNDDDDDDIIVPGLEDEDDEEEEEDEVLEISNKQ